MTTSLQTKDTMSNYDYDLDLQQIVKRRAKIQYNQFIRDYLRNNLLYWYNRNGFIDLKLYKALQLVISYHLTTTDYQKTSNGLTNKQRFNSLWGSFKHYYKYSKYVLSFKLLLKLARVCKYKTFVDDSEFIEKRGHNLIRHNIWGSYKIPQI